MATVRDERDLAQQTLLAEALGEAITLGMSRRPLQALCRAVLLGPAVDVTDDLLLLHDVLTPDWEDYTHQWPTSVGESVDALACVMSQRGLLACQLITDGAMADDLLVCRDLDQVRAAVTRDLGVTRDMEEQGDLDDGYVEIERQAWDEVLAYWRPGWSIPDREDEAEMDRAMKTLRQFVQVARRRVTSVKCPECSAEPGQDCQDGDRRLEFPHEGRHLMAAAQRNP
jgi:hypothetical protein